MLTVAESYTRWLTSDIEVEGRRGETISSKVLGWLWVGRRRENGDVILRRRCCSQNPCECVGYVLCFSDESLMQAQKSLPLCYDADEGLDSGSAGTRQENRLSAISTTSAGQTAHLRPLRFSIEELHRHHGVTTDSWRNVNRQWGEHMQTARGAIQTVSWR